VGFLLLYAWSLTLLLFGLGLAVSGLVLEKRWHGAPARQTFAKAIALLGELLCPVAIVSMIYEFNLRNVFVKDMSEAVDASVSRALLARENAYHSFEFGLRDVHEGYGMDVLAAKAVAAQEIRIEIPWFEDEGAWKDRLPAFASDPRKKFTIFIAGTDAEWTKKRGIVLESNSQYGQRKVQSTLELLKRSLAGNPNAHVYQMRDCMPALLIIEYDSNAVVGFYLNSGHSVRNPQLDVQTAVNRKRTRFGKMVDQEFARLAACSQAVDLNK